MDNFFFYIERDGTLVGIDMIPCPKFYCAFFFLKFELINFNSGQVDSRLLLYGMDLDSHSILTYLCWIKLLL